MCICEGAAARAKKQANFLHTNLYWFCTNTLFTPCLNKQTCLEKNILLPKSFPIQICMEKICLFFGSSGSTFADTHFKCITKKIAY